MALQAELWEMENKLGGCCGPSYCCTPDQKRNIVKKIQRHRKELKRLEKMEMQPVSQEELIEEADEFERKEKERLSNIRPRR